MALGLVRWVVLALVSAAVIVFWVIRPVRWVVGMTRVGTTCAVCDRTIEWDRDGSMRSCSGGCRDTGVSPTDRALEQAIRSLLATRATDATICPSEAARLVGGEDWRELMEPTRAAARRLVAVGEAEITQAGVVVVDPATAKGPIRVRRARG